MPLAELVREIVEDYLEQKVKPPVKPTEVFLRIVGLGTSGKTDVSDRYDYYLAEALGGDNS